MENETYSPDSIVRDKDCIQMRELRRSKERADLKDQVRSAKAIQIKSTRGFA